MSGLLVDVFSFGNTAKRKIKGLLDDPVGSITQYINNENDRAGRFNQLTSEAAQEGAQAIKQGKSMVGPKSQQLAGLLADAYNPTGMFIGASAKTWDKAAAEKAQKLLKDGVDPRQVWKETGTFKGADGALRQEIPDNLATERAYQLTPAKAYEKARFDAMINDSQPMRDRANSMAPYWQMPKKQLHEEYARTGGEIVDAALSGDKELAKKLMDNRSGLDAILQEMRSATYGPASSFLKHGDLGKAYPDVYKLHTRISPDDLGDSVKGQYMRERPGMGEQMILRNKPMLDSDKSTMLHEIQHAIQQREGWAKGGSMDDFYNESMRARQGAWDQISAINSELSKAAGTPRYQELLNERQKLVDLAQKDPLDLKEQAYKSYQSLAGEAEARATQARMNMNAAQRREVYPFDSYDVPVDQLIIRGGLLSN